MTLSLVENASTDYITERTEGCLKRAQDRLCRSDADPLARPYHPARRDNWGFGSAQGQRVRFDIMGSPTITVPMMTECEQYGHLTANQVGYNLFDRRMEAEVLPYCLAQGIGYMAYGSLGFGLLTGAFTADTTFVEWDWRSRGSAFGLPLFERENFLKELKVVARLKELAAGYNKSVPQLAIAWLLGNPAVTVGLVGMRNEHELKENVAAADWRLTDDDRAEIDRDFC